jgi:TonB family protein
MLILKKSISFHILFILFIFYYVSSCSSLTSKVDRKTDTVPHRHKTIDFYRVEIARLVLKNWEYNEEDVGVNPNLLVSLVFKVMPNGEIKDIFFIDRSGNTVLDNSAYQAILKTNPVPPHPKCLNEAFVDLGLRFTPNGIK